MMKFDPDFTHIRRKDRAVADDAWIEAFLQRAPFGVLATARQDQPYIHGILFAYDAQRRVIYLHSANEGRTIENVRMNPKICFTVAEMGRLLPHPRASGFSVEYGSVVIFGVARLVDEPEEMLFGLGKIMEKYAPHLQPGADYRVMDESDLKGVAVYCIEIAGWSGKRRQAAQDVPGAYRLEEVLTKPGTPNSTVIERV
jgi:nitroimidazol reductase NimA-like FMN-containing flavoprotein (pyridoxamine 5'-phosphate oxidase superfamily)